MVSIGLCLIFIAFHMAGMSTARAEGMQYMFCWIDLLYLENQYNEIISFVIFIFLNNIHEVSNQMVNQYCYSLYLPSAGYPYQARYPVFMYGAGARAQYAERDQVRNDQTKG